jgi:hypothetical protein
MEPGDMDDFFNNMFSDGDGPSMPVPTPEDLRKEAMHATKLHISAFNEASEIRDKAYQEMLPIWAEELEYYLPILEDFEEYEQCQLVFDTQRAIRTERANIKLNKELRDLKVDVTYEVEPANDDNNEDNELDF